MFDRVTAPDEDLTVATRFGTVTIPATEIGALVKTAAAADRRELLMRLHQRLLDLQSTENPSWSGFRMLQRLLRTQDGARRGRSHG